MNRHVERLIFVVLNLLSGKMKLSKKCKMMNAATYTKKQKVKMLFFFCVNLSLMFLIASIGGAILGFYTGSPAVFAAYGFVWGAILSQIIKVEWVRDDN
jgi:hypothetical protein